MSDLKTKITSFLKKKKQFLLNLFFGLLVLFGSYYAVEETEIGDIIRDVFEREPKVISPTIISAEYTIQTKNICYSNGKCEKTIYSGPMFSNSFGELINESQSLMYSEFQPYVLNIKEDGIHSVNVLDFTHDTITLEVSLTTKEKKEVPVKLYEKVLVLKEEELPETKKQEFVVGDTTEKKIEYFEEKKIELVDERKTIDFTLEKKETDISTYVLKPGQELHIGETSTIISYDFQNDAGSTLYAYDASRCSSGYNEERGPSTAMFNNCNAHNDITTNTNIKNSDNSRYSSSLYVSGDTVRSLFLYLESYVPELVEPGFVLNNITWLWEGYFSTLTSYSREAYFWNASEEKWNMVDSAFGGTTEANYYFVVDDLDFYDDSDGYIGFFIAYYLTSGTEWTTRYMYTDYVSLTIDYEIATIIEPNPEITNLEIIRNEENMIFFDLETNRDYDVLWFELEYPNGTKKNHTAITQTVNVTPFEVIESFTDVGSHNWIVPVGVTEVEVLVVAGGGGSAKGNAHSAYNPGAGGGGGVIFQNYSVTFNESLNITIGDGGNGVSVSNNARGSQGGESIFGNLTAIGGGGGGGTNGEHNGGEGGSGGGAGVGGTLGSGGISLQPTSASGGYGNDGADASSGTAGGGGGAGGLADGISGGSGLTIWGNVYGKGGNAHSDGSDGTDNTGAGANSVSVSSIYGGGKGGSGIVLFKYTADKKDLPSFNFTDTSQIGEYKITNIYVGNHDREYVQLNSTGSWSVPSNINSIDVVVVGGGGGSGRGETTTTRNAGGGGAGELVYELDYSVTPSSSISYTIGSGGSGASSVSGKGSSGSNSSFGTLSVVGGGGAGSSQSRPGVDGGSGGGAGVYGANTGTGGSSTATSDYGNDGASSTSGIAGGGGGAVSAGTGIIGGAGMVFNGIEYAKGGDAHSDGSAGVANTGSGGNAYPTSSSATGSSGGTGVVLILMTHDSDGVLLKENIVLNQSTYTNLSFNVVSGEDPYADISVKISSGISNIFYRVTSPSVKNLEPIGQTSLKGIYNITNNGTLDSIGVCMWWNDTYTGVKQECAPNYFESDLINLTTTPQLIISGLNTGVSNMIWCRRHYDNPTGPKNVGTLFNVTTNGCS